MTPGELRCPRCDREVRGALGRARCDACDRFAVERLASDAGAGDPLLGARVLGRFVALARRASGATASVYDAFDLETEASVVLKVVRHERGQGDPFAREACILRSLALPVVPTILASGEHALPPPRDDALAPGSATILAMTLARGRPLGTGEPGSLARAERLAESALAVLGALHAQGVAHGDLKPSHLFVDEAGEVVGLVDFGSATAPLAPERISRTPAYAPTDDDPGPRYDLFSLGTILRRAAWFGSTTEASTAGSGLLRFVERALAASPADRPATAEAASALLRGEAPAGHR